MNEEEVLDADSDQGNTGKSFEHLLSTLHSVGLHSLEEQVLHIERVLQDLGDEGVSGFVNELLSKTFVLDFGKPKENDPSAWTYTAQPSQILALLTETLEKTPSKHQSSATIKEFELHFSATRQRRWYDNILAQQKNFLFPWIQRLPALPSLPRAGSASPDDLLRAAHLWEIELRFPATSPDPADVGYALWAFSKALGSIPGVTLEITDVQRGSIIAKITMKMRDFMARERTQQLLEDTRNGVLRLGDKGAAAAEAHFMDRPIEEVEKIKADKEKAQKETERIEKELEQMPSDEEAQRLRKLRIEAEELDVELKREQLRTVRLDNQRKELENMKDMVGLATSGILKIDMEITMNGHPYLIHHDGTVRAGVNMQVIADAGQLLPPSADNPPEGPAGSPADG